MISALTSLTAVTSPDSETVATASSDDDHSTVNSLSDVEVTLSCKVSPTVISAVSLSIEYWAFAHAAIGMHRANIATSNTAMSFDFFINIPFIIFYGNYRFFLNLRLNA